MKKIIIMMIKIIIMIIKIIIIRIIIRIMKIITIDIITIDDNITFETRVSRGCRVS